MLSSDLGDDQRAASEAYDFPAISVMAQLTYS